MKYRRIVIIFMLVVLNVLVTKSKNEERTLESFIKEMKEYAQEGSYLITTQEINGLEQPLHMAKKKIKEAYTYLALAEKKILGIDVNALILPGLKKKYYLCAIDSFTQSICCFSICASSFLKLKIIDDNARKAYIWASASALLRAANNHEAIKNLIVKNKGLPDPYHRTLEKIILYMSETEQKLLQRTENG